MLVMVINTPLAYDDLYTNFIETTCTVAFLFQFLISFANFTTWEITLRETQLAKNEL